ncbi:hypothetical protein CYFUS_003992 [Cystobacter fuscus]|uniref:DUF1761 domain-containing protein n=1 Tax=Cystobacter fuscus TaxID=43 RepID=A0A250J4X3_9BACT|nr:DUF1761 domain-containing protein [Cystobacter fuscus]ATB38557.1 hypothetical protein CYFUS_003992 [Cystobacter fuscus]
MLDSMTRINWLAVLAATFAATMLGGVWFTVLFGKAYASILGRAHDPKAKPAPLFILGPLVCSLLTIITSALLMKALDLSSVGDAMAFGGVIGLGYLVATMANTAINPNMPRPLMYSLVSGPYFFLMSIISSLILVAMP